MVERGGEDTTSSGDDLIGQRSIALTNIFTHGCY